MTINSARTTGVLHVHSCPAALVPHVEWAVAAEFGTPATLTWSCQPAEHNTMRAEVTWRGSAGTAGRLAAALRGWKLVRYEVTEQASPGHDGERWSVTPSLGVFRCATSTNGDLLVDESRLRAVLATSSGPALSHGLDQLLGGAWDAELEPFRQAAEGAAVSWLHQVV